MSAPSSFPCFQIPTSPLSRNSSSTSSSPCSSSSPCIFPTVKTMTRTRTTYSMSFYVRSSQTDGPLRRPVVTPPTPPSRPPESSVSAPKPIKRVEEDANVITMEFQRQKAKELQDYFKQKKFEEASQGPFFGFLPKNEIANGRWAMFGFAVGLLTEYATGSDFVDQLKILLSNFGIVDLE